MFDLIPELADVLRDPLRAARASGRPIVMFASNNVPVELIHAAGCFPLQWPTAPLAATPHADRYLEAGFDPMARSALEQLLRGDWNDVQLLILPRTIDSLQRLYYYLCELRRSFSETLPEPFLYDLLHTPFDTSASHNLVSTRALLEQLEAVPGAQPVSDVRLAESVAAYDRIRLKLATILARRHAEPCQLAGEHVLELYTVAQRVLPEVFESSLDRLLVSQPTAAPGVRVLLAGSAHDTPALHRHIANAGGQVVADFHWRGDLLFGPPIESSRGLTGLAEHYHRHSLSCRTYPVPILALLDSARNSRAQVALFFYYDEEEALTWDYPAQRDALKTLGIQSFALERQPYPPTGALEPSIREFIARASRSA
ncbi:MAG TPA: 2-hydroxyacyl-CoA dehydratase family protein [Polyangiales bacterium]|nr:2-hydroxyacyl-CoA dehydratase family protein [Polyangiales bacterium]